MQAVPLASSTGMRMARLLPGCGECIPILYRPSAWVCYVQIMVSSEVWCRRRSALHWIGEGLGMFNQKIVRGNTGKRAG